MAQKWGDTSSDNNFITFLEETFTIFGDKKVGIVRLDSGFCLKEIREYLEQKQLNYIIVARFTHPNTAIYR